MKLVLCAQDIQTLTIGLAQAGVMKQECTVETSPEGYLLHVHRMLGEWSLTLEELEEIIVVTGPGSFTASRVSTTIANSLAFTQRIPVTGIDNPMRLSLQELLWQTLNPSRTYVTPSYDRPAQLTMRKKCVDKKTA